MCFVHVTCHLEYTMIHLYTWAILDFNLRGHIKERIDSLKYLILVSFLSQVKIEYYLFFFKSHFFYFQVITCNVESCMEFINQDTCKQFNKNICE